MSTLRVLLRDPPRPDRAEEWALCDDAGTVVRSGRDVPAAWPRADAGVAVLAASRARLVVLSLPPLPPARLAAAVAFALEDQLAAGDDPPQVALAPQRADGTVTAAVAGRNLVAAIAAGASGWARVVPEAALPPANGRWTWYASAAGGGFVHAPRGSFAADPDDGNLPPELVAALAQARRDGTAPDAIGLAFACDPVARARYAEAGGMPFPSVPAWRWTDATRAAVEQAPDWLARPPQDERGRHALRVRAFRPAVALAVAALVLHVGATLVQWAWLHAAAWRTGNAIVALARDAGLADAQTTPAATAALVRRNAVTRHAAGFDAPGDAWPLLAQATPALALLPAGALKTAQYSDGAWTLELGRVDDATLARIDRALAERGVVALRAPAAGGLRMRLTGEP